MIDFAGYIRSAMARAGLSLTAFAAAVGRSPGNVSNILKQDPNSKTQFKPPLDDIPKWAQALGLNESESKFLVELAELCHAPAGLRERYCRLRDLFERESIEDRYNRLRRDAEDPNKIAAIIKEYQDRQVLIDRIIAARRQEEEAIARLVAQSETIDDTAWEPDTTDLPARRVADSPAETRTAGGPYRTRPTGPAD